MTLDRLATEMMAGFYGINERLDGHDERFNGIDKQIGGLTNQVGGLAENMKQVKQRLTNIENDVAEIKTDLKAHGNAIDKDAILLINHGKRIVRLEKAVR